MQISQCLSSISSANLKFQSQFQLRIFNILTRTLAKLISICFADNSDNTSLLSSHPIDHTFNIFIHKSFLSSSPHIHMRLYAFSFSLKTEHQVQFVNIKSQFWLFIVAQYQRMSQHREWHQPQAPSNGANQRQLSICVEWFRSSFLFPPAT